MPMPMESANKVTSIEDVYNGNFLSVRMLNGWFESIHENRCHGFLVAVLIFDRNDSTGHKVLGRWEHNPAYRPGLSLVSITGGVEDGNPDETAVHEAMEEAGADIKVNDLIRLGEVHPYKAADTTVILYAYDGRGLDLCDPMGDGSEGERGAFCEWIPARRAALCEDPLVSTMITRLRLYNGVDLLA